jgi:hypothetical protein
MSRTLNAILPLFLMVLRFPAYEALATESPLEDTGAEVNVEQKRMTRDMPRRESVVPKDMKKMQERFR